ncbi:MAG: 23S rRNA (uracil(1939)-C(5))-methyltransferase RlmD [Candidatus Ratteibacteria bacterium]|jgi:23S rRNA (uracil1939-C5)-methyltransferase
MALEIILASESPRRKELMAKVLPQFRVEPSGIPEACIESDPLACALKNASLKAKAVGERFPNALVVAADTVVAMNTRIFGKPSSREEAVLFLEMLSENRHRVITAVSLFHQESGRILTRHEITKILFNPLSPEMITDYLNLNTYQDKAGAYAIQEIGDTFVASIDGGYDNVMGLPVEMVQKMISLFEEGLFEIDITDISLPDTFGVGRQENLVIFVPHTVPGDRVWTHIRKKKKSFAYGEMNGISNSSPLRREPVCPYFGVCGGCVLQHLDYSEQLAIKKAAVQNNLLKIGGIAADSYSMKDIIPSPDLYGYRNKMEFAFGTSGDRTVLGLRKRSTPLQRGGRGIVPLEECPIFSDCVKTIFPPIVEYINKNNLKPYDPFTRKGFLRHLLVREGKNTGEIMVVLVTRKGKLPDILSFAENLLEQEPRITSLFWVENDKIADVIAFDKKHHLLGNGWIEEKLGSFRFRIHPQSFFQTNTKAAELLYKEVLHIAELSGNERILGLYCGTGPIELYLSKNAAFVQGIDSCDTNISDATTNCRINKISNCSFRSGIVEKLKAMDTFDLVVVDPPREGLTPKAFSALLTIKAPRILYVSCNPATLARDAKLLAEQNYLLRTIRPVDMFPHTGHIETIALFSKMEK